jgi:Uncharacterized protein conserved in bacteria (DUF2252)
MNIVKATDAYETWLAERMPLLADDLEYKHERMAADEFEFMRATFYRWVQLWAKHCESLHDASEVLSVGDLHTDNFGSWRDIEGRLVWGINDFDEAYPLPYAFDLVRLATSAYLAATAAFGSAQMDSICKAILSGYREGLKFKGAPFVLAEEYGWLRDLVMEDLKEPKRFWEKLESIPPLADPAPDEVIAIIDSSHPRPGLPNRLGHRTAGLGSLGRRRYLALMRLDNAFAAREAKELTASACLWAGQDQGSSAILYSAILANAVRSPDPFLIIRDRWVVRRLSPDYSRIDLTQLSESNLDMILNAMGWETSNIHLGSGEDRAKEIRKDLKDRGKDWLVTAAEAMHEATLEDFYNWQEYWSGA